MLPLTPTSNVAPTPPICQIKEPSSFTLKFCPHETCIGSMLHIVAHVPPRLSLHRCATLPLSTPIEYPSLVGPCFATLILLNLLFNKIVPLPRTCVSLVPPIYVALPSI